MGRASRLIMLGGLVLAMACAPFGVLSCDVFAHPSSSGMERAATEAPTFHADVLPILERHCQVCHRSAGAPRSGMVAPMALVHYAQVRPWARSIARVTRERSMPPWFASEQFVGVFEHERRLSELEIEVLTRWALAGAPPGDRRGGDQRSGDRRGGPAPLPAEAASQWTLGEPDLVVEMPERYWVADEVDDLRATFEVVLSLDQLSEDRWIRWIEFRPGNPDLVHHGGATVVPLDPEGHTRFDRFSGGKIIGTAPGDGPDLWPPGYGKLVRRGSKIVFDLHYHKEMGPGSGAFDRSKIAIKWHTEPVKHVVRSLAVSSFGWEIPPRHENWRIGAAHTFEQDSFLLSMMPHMHSRGKAARYELIYPDTTSGSASTKGPLREVILDIPEYDSNWQLTYTLKQPKFLPSGTRLEVTMWFDNSGYNRRLNESPDRAVGFGERANDEMNLGWVEVSNARPLRDGAHDEP